MNEEQINRIKKNFKQFNLISTDDLKQLNDIKREGKTFQVAKRVDPPKPINSQLPQPINSQLPQAIISQPLRTFTPYPPQETQIFSNTNTLDFQAPSIPIPDNRITNQIEPAAALIELVSVDPIAVNPNTIAQTNIDQIVPAIAPISFNNYITRINQIDTAPPAPAYYPGLQEVQQDSSDQGIKKQRNQRNNKDKGNQGNSINLVSCPREPLVAILSIKDDSLLVLVTSNAVFLQSAACIHDPNKAIKLYTLPPHHLFTGAFASSSHLLFSTISRTTQDQEVQQGGIVLIDLGSATGSAQGSQVQSSSSQQSPAIKKVYLKNIELSRITGIAWNDLLGLLMLSTSSGNLHGFAQNLERIFFYEDPKGEPISSLIYDEQYEKIIYGTELGSICCYNLNTETGETIFKSQGSVRFASLISLGMYPQLFVVYENGQASKAILLTYPEMEQKYQFSIDSPNYACIHHVNNLYYAGFLSSNILSIYSLNSSKAVKVFSKGLDSNPTCFSFNTHLLHMKLIQVYYSNPSIVREDRYTNDRCRYLIDEIID